MSVSNKWARIEELCVLKNAFSLMEMMVVLLIVAILAAATAPMVTKKMARNAGSGDSPWVYTGLNNSIAFNMNRNDNSPVIIGASSLPASLESPTRLFIDSGDNASHIAFGNGNTTPIGITADPTNGRIGISNQQIPNSSIAFGAEQTISNNPTGIIALGQGVSVSGQDSIVLGRSAMTAEKAQRAISIGVISEFAGMGDVNQTSAGNDSIAIGSAARANGTRCIAIGSARPADWGGQPVQTGVGKSNNDSIAIGTYSYVSANNATGIGSNTYVEHENSTAIGHGASTTEKDQIVLGTKTDTVYIPGNLIVGKDAYIGSSYGKFTGSHFRLFLKRNDNAWTQLSEADGSDNTVKADYQNVSLPWSSDRRLKNVGEAYTAGLDELKKLDFFHYTFKKDEAKTPHVGVMAQDLQKVFPDAVTEGDDGYLRIRMEDMFYAVINAVKELDKKITQIVENVTSLSKKVDEQEKIIAEQQKLIEELQAQNANIEKRLAKVEKKSKKVAE